MASLTTDSTVAVIGAGTMGAGIAQVAALNGHRVQLHDTWLGAGDAAKKGIAASLHGLVDKGRLGAADADAAIARISTVVTLADSCVAQLVIEAIVEDLDAKRDLLASLENVVTPDCVLASNTSSFSITALASGCVHPERVVGMHFFNPAPVMPLVEIVTGLATSRAVAEAAYAVARSWGKTPVYALSTPGFIVNRCARPFYGEGLRLLAERAADPATIDAVVREAGGFRMGPFELIDLIGLDVNFAVTKSVWEAYYHDPRYAPSVLQQERVVAGFLGRKTKRGFYDYAPSAQKPAPDTEPKRTPPARATVHGNLGTATPLADRMKGGGIAVAQVRDDTRFPGGAIHIAAGERDTWLALTDGRTATKRAADTGIADLVLFDLALDYAAATRIAVARADTCSDAGYACAVAVLQAAGMAVSRLDDVAGLAVLRIVAMLANEAADAVVQGVAEPEAIDLAMQKGVNYPRGPLAWADSLGASAICDALANLAQHYGEERYRTSPLLKRRASTGRTLCG
jgi:3-hydroxybutyryl-CoA dehydrogenase